MQMLHKDFMYDRDIDTEKNRSHDLFTFHKTLSNETTVIFAYINDND